MIYLCETVTGLKQGSKEKKEECQDQAIVKKVKISENEYYGIFALADGAGSAKFAKQGADLSTTFFIEEVEKNLNVKSTNLVLSEEFLKDVMVKVREKLLNYAKTKQLILNDFHTTFTVGIFHSKDEKGSLICGSVGDSIIVVLEQFQDKKSQKSDCRNISKLTKGEYVNQTAFFTSKRWKDALTIEKVDNPLGVFMSSDGLNNIYFNYHITKENTETEDNYKKWIWNVKLNKDYIWKFYNAIKDRVLTSELLINILNSDDILELNNDDKSFIFLVFK